MKNKFKTAQIIEANQIISSIQTRIVNAILSGASLGYNIQFDIRECPNMEGWKSYEQTGGFSVIIDLRK